MTTPATSKPAPATNKPVPAPTKVAPTTEKPTDGKVVSPAPVTTVETNGNDSRIPEALLNIITKNMCELYLAALDEIAEYNKERRVDKKADAMTSLQVINKARELVSPTDANTPVDAELKTIFDKFDAVKIEHDKLRKSLIEQTSKVLGIDSPATTERDEELEAPLREKRKLAVGIGSQLEFTATVNTDPATVEAIGKFLSTNPLPAVGRGQTHTFGNDEKATPKYRVDVIVEDADGNIKLQKPSLSAAAIALPGLYARGKAPKADWLREKWEAAGNTAEKTVKDPVEFEDNDLFFKISKKK